jgi:hypothetical protein
VKSDLALRVLGNIMSWGDEQAHEEFQRLRLMAAVKYDGYRDFEAGVRFLESLAAWLQQFARDERPAAYQFVVNRLVYIGPGEMEKLVAQLYPNFVRPQLLRTVAEELGIPAYMVNASEKATDLIASRRRRTLFLGLSDGARVDYIRHQNVGLFSNEQVVGSTQLDRDKWQDLLVDLRKDTEDESALFDSVYRLDDFTATGTSFFRVDEESGAPKGKLCRFAKSVMNAQKELNEPILSDAYSLHVHHYVGTAEVARALRKRLNGAAGLLEPLGISTSPDLTFGVTLPAWVPLSDGRSEDLDFLALVDKYYDPSIETKHTRMGGTEDMRLGYGGCALPLVLDHNTPNNSIPLIWAETEGKSADGDNPADPAMRPLFRRRQRHV